MVAACPTRNWARSLRDRIRPFGTRPRARTERHTSTDRGVGSAVSPSSSAFLGVAAGFSGPTALAAATSASLAFAMSPGRTALGSAVSIMTVPLLRPMATAAIAGRSVATRTMRGLRGLTEKQLASDRMSPTQAGLSAAACAPSNAAVRDPTAAEDGDGLVPGIVPAMNATSVPVAACIRLGAVTRGHDAYAKRADDETGQRQVQPAAKPRSRTEKAEFWMSILGRGHGATPTSLAPIPAILEVHQPRGTSSSFRIQRDERSICRGRRHPADRGSGRRGRFGGSLLPARAGLIGFRFAALQISSTQARRFDDKRTSTWRSRLPAGHALLASIVA